jgi:hypothetical protein
MTQETPQTEGTDLPPVPGPDSWSEAEAADWDPSDETTDTHEDGAS